MQVSQHILTHLNAEEGGTQPLWLHAHCRTHTLLHRPSFSFPQEGKPVPSCPKHSRGSCARTGVQGKQPFCVAAPLPALPAPGRLSERRKTHSKRLPKYQSALQSPREERFSSPAEAAVNKHGTCFIACHGCPLPSADLTPAQGRRGGRSPRARPPPFSPCLLQGHRGWQRRCAVLHTAMENRADPCADTIQGCPGIRSISQPRHSFRPASSTQSRGFL